MGIRGDNVDGGEAGVCLQNAARWGSFGPIPADWLRAEIVARPLMVEKARKASPNDEPWISKASIDWLPWANESSI
jgi:hypothetical protein